MYVIYDSRNAIPPSWPIWNYPSFSAWIPILLDSLLNPSGLDLVLYVVFPQHSKPSQQINNDAILHMHVDMSNSPTKLTASEGKRHICLFVVIFSRFSPVHGTMDSQKYLLKGWINEWLSMLTREGKVIWPILLIVALVKLLSLYNLVYWALGFRGEEKEQKRDQTFTVAPGKKSQLPVSIGSRLSSKTTCLWAELMTRTLSKAQQASYTSPTRRFSCFHWNWTFSPLASSGR